MSWRDRLIRIKFELYKNKHDFRLYTYYEHKKAVKYNNFFLNFVSSKDKMEFFEIAITESDTLYTCINRSFRSHSCASLF